MGFLSKKTVTCSRCGKEFEERFPKEPYLCSDCRHEINLKRDPVEGYLSYASMSGMNREYSEEELEQIAAHRQAILDKYRMTSGISRAELKNVSDNYKKLSDEQAADVLYRIGNSSLRVMGGAAVKKVLLEKPDGSTVRGAFIVPTGVYFEGMIVDTADVFAAGYARDSERSDENYEGLICALFTNDPYVPVVPMVYYGKIGFFEMTKSKKGREGAEDFIKWLCPNLEYPVQELKKLKHQIKKDGSVKGSVDMEFMLKKISDASLGVGIFEVLPRKLPQKTANMMDAYGYISSEEIDEILHMDQTFNRHFWEKQLKKLSK